MQASSFLAYQQCITKVIGMDVNNLSGVLMHSLNVLYLVNTNNMKEECKG